VPEHRTANGDEFASMLHEQQAPAAIGSQDFFGSIFSPRKVDGVTPPLSTSHHAPGDRGVSNRDESALRPLGWRALDIRHRLPDRMGQGAANFGQRQSTYVGVSKPQTGAYRSKASVTSLPAGSEVEVSGKAEF